MLTIGHSGPSEKEVEIFSRTSTQLISKGSNLGHQEYPHPLYDHHIINYGVSGIQILSPTKSPIHVGNYKKTKVQFLLVSQSEIPHCWHHHKIKITSIHKRYHLQEMETNPQHPITFFAFKHASLHA